MKLLPTACILTCAMPKSIGLDLYSPMSVLVSSTWQSINKHENCFSNSHGLLWSNSPQVRFGLTPPHPCRCWGGGPWLHWTCPSVVNESQSPESHYRSEPSHHPINSGENCLSNPLWSATNTSDRAWYPWIQFNWAMNKYKKGNLIGPSYPKKDINEWTQMNLAMPSQWHTCK